MFASSLYDDTIQHPDTFLIHYLFTRTCSVRRLQCMLVQSRGVNHVVLSVIPSFRADSVDSTDRCSVAQAGYPPRPHVT